MKRPPATGGMRHIALYVHALETCEHFYVELLGMQVEWRPDPDNVYLTSGNDNLALHRANTEFDTSGAQKLDHIGFIIKTAEQVDEWFAFLSHHAITTRQPPRTHRDGARSFYCYDPAGTIVQIIYHPPIS
ncbi:MAG: catechol 2,3-dioxygenase-like lactoylglutathione lyase family enzyme [Methylophagaceae bacterium]|jgi:catechol 2,3-dioxygenase-like lactoylglutathione lyase family enzyme